MTDQEMTAYIQQLRAERKAEREAFETWLRQQDNLGVIDAIMIAGLYRRITGCHIDWHDTATILEKLETQGVMRRVGSGRDGFVEYIQK